MSNHLVGTVYQCIIEEVIGSSIVDFEEAGVNSSTLDELKLVWQQKLSDLKVAVFPWDPPPQEPVQQVPQPGQAPQYQSQQQNQQVHIKQENGGPRIKTEPGQEPQGVYGTAQASLAGNPTHDPNLAQMRAIQKVENRFGPQLLAKPPGPSGLVLPGPPQAAPQHHQQQQQAQQQQQQQAQQQQQQAQQQRSVQQNGIPQHDGVDDYDHEIPIEGFGHLTRSEADQIFLKRVNKAERERVKNTEELAQALGNLKVGSKGKGKARRMRKLDAYEAVLDPTCSYPYPSSTPAFGESSTSAATLRVPQLDGDDYDDDIPDEDAINSDLDDPDDDEIDEDNEDESPQIMLCMYDKVQRTKNKWKCVLKDGVLTINGKEYVFHKANGEYEW